MTTLFTAILEIAKVICVMRTSQATAAGTVNTLIDTTLKDSDDSFNKGTLWFLAGTAQNVGKTTVPTDYVLSSGTITFPTQTAPTALNDRYAVANARVQRVDLIKALNQVLMEIGDLDQEDTSLTTLANTEEYSLPTGVVNVRKVEIASNTAPPYSYYPYVYWMEMPTAGKLRFDMDQLPDTGYKIRLTYWAAHAEMISDASVVSPYIPLEYVKWLGAEYALHGLVLDLKSMDKEVMGLYQLAEKKAVEMRKIRIPRTPMAIRFMY